jgi:hypothetical protein
MAKVYYEPYKAIKYVGTKAKAFNTSLARPKPTLKKGDIVIVDKVTAFNLVKKGFGDFVSVDAIEFVKSDKESAETITHLQDENEKLKEELATALDLIGADDDDKKDPDDVSGDGE